MKWSELKPAARYAIIGGGVLLLAGIIAAVVLLGGDEKPAATLAPLPEATLTVEPTVTIEPTQAAVATATPPVKKPTPVKPAPPVDKRIFGQLKGIRDESGGAWSDLWIDVDRADYLTGQAALDYLTSVGEDGGYSPDYWYARQEGAAVTSYKLPATGAATKVKVAMYSWPTVPAPGFYGPGMAVQNIGFGEFYDEIYMNGDTDDLINRYYWFTVTSGVCMKIQEQPRDPFYEP
ncbi:MAG: hypothetical protein Q8S43_09290 [Actinomycetota bacterium]|nr:hypothetical protein [Actinomycetota bacterium]